MNSMMNKGFKEMSSESNQNVSWQQVRVRAFGGPEQVEVVTHQGLPIPKAGEIRVRVEATSASFTDTIIRRGRYPEAPSKLPLALGYELVGVVDALGAGVTTREVGQRVAALTMLGANAGYVCLEASSVVPIGKDIEASIDAAEGVSMVLSFMTAYQMLYREAKAKRGTRILVHGGGGAVGDALLQLGAIEGMEMFATASAVHHESIRAKGATPIDYTKEDFVSVVNELTNGEGVDVVFDFADIAQFRRSFSLLRKGGALLIYGFHKAVRETRKGGKMVMVRGFLKGIFQMLWWNMMPNGKRAVFYSIRDKQKQKPDWFEADLQALFKLLAEGKLTPRIAQKMPLSDAPKAHQLLDAGGVKGKLILLP